MPIEFDEEKYLAESKCDTCGKTGIVGVACMPGVPISFGYCRECLTANAHPYFAVVGNTASCGGYEHTADWWKDIVQCTLKHLHKSMEEFIADVKVDMDDFEKHMEEQEAQNAGD
jgi:hypothetical protein